ncbi:MAG: DUF2808 domain-containing protein [Synechococcus sp.]|nr:DUF2808 domain-containing protein [Synechococcus sp.]
MATLLSLGLPLPAGALELNGSTVFVRAPWKVDLRSYRTNVFERWAEYYFTLTLPEDAGASLGGLTIQQTRGADWQFPFSAERTKAFLGEPRREGAPIPVEAQFDPDLRRITLRFPEPIPPGSRFTVVLVPWHNPSQADTYLFQVEALPSGERPVPSPVGTATLRIYSADWY